MPATVDIHGIYITFDGARIECSDPKLKRRAFLRTQDIHDHMPQPNNLRAQRLVDQLGGRIVTLDPPEASSADTIH